MSVKILNREYINLYAPANEQPKPDWLIGNTGDWIKLNIEVEAGVDFVASASEPLSLNAEEKSIKLMNGRKWGEYGFDINQDVKLSFFVTTMPEEGSAITESFVLDLHIVNIFNDILVYEESGELSSFPYEIIPTDRGGLRVHGVKIFDEREMQGVRLKYANIQNSEIASHGLTSFIDGTETELLYVGLNSPDTSFRDMELIGLQSGMSILNGRVRKNAPVDNSENAAFVGSMGNEQSITVPTGRRHYGHSVAFQKNTGNTPPFQNQAMADYAPVGQDSYGAGLPGQMFIRNIQSAGFRNVHVKLSTVITNNYSQGENRRLQVVLMRYTEGEAYQFAERRILAEYGAYNEIRWIELIYDNILAINMQEGESYSLGYCYAYEDPNASRAVSFACTTASRINVEKIINETDYRKKYTIELNFMLSSFWEDALEFLELQPPGNLFNAASLTDNISIKFYPEWNNPNIITENDMTQTERLGNTGWFNENYNGLSNDFQIRSVNYFDLGGFPAQSLSYGNDIRVKAIIGGINGIGAQSVFNYGFGWIPQDEQQYKNKITGFHKNTKINSPANAAFNLGQLYPAIYEGFAEDAAKMNAKNISFNRVGDDLVFEATFTPSAEFSNFFINRDGDRNYYLWLSVSDSGQPTNFSNRVNLLLDINEMQFFIPISDELANVNNTFLEHPESDTAAGKTFYKGFLEDDILTRSFFPLKKGARLDRVTMGYEVENTTTGLTYELDRFTANLQNFITSNGGVQEIDYNSERGYKLEPNNNKNWVKIIRNESNDTALASGYKILFAAKIRWEQWLQRVNVPVEFYNNQLPFNGSENNWLDYLRAGTNHKINYFIIFDVREGDVLIRYKNAFELSFNGYDENTNITTEHKYYNNFTGALLNIGNDQETGRPLGVVLSNVNTRIEIIYTKLVGNWDLGNVYAVTTFEVDKGAGVLEHRQLSSIWGSEVDNILIPLDGQEKLLVEQIAPNKIKTSCLVDYTKLTPVSRFKITGRIGCFKNNNGVPINAKIYDPSQYENKYE
jgi:hypothetical protein